MRTRQRQLLAAAAAASAAVTSRLLNEGAGGLSHDGEVREIAADAAETLLILLQQTRGPSNVECAALDAVQALVDEYAAVRVRERDEINRLASGAR